MDEVFGTYSPWTASSAWAPVVQERVQQPDQPAIGGREELLEAPVAYPGPPQLLVLAAHHYLATDGVEVPGQWSRPVGRRVMRLADRLLIRQVVRR